MNNSLFQGSCHCGRINFQVKDTRISEDLYKCNCSLCKKKGIVMKPLEKNLFKLIKGEEFLSSYKWNKLIAEHFLCKICGVYTHHKRRRNPEQISINFACLENISFPSEGEIDCVDGASHD